MNKNRINEIRVFADGLSFPVLLFVHDDQQHELVMRLSEHMGSTKYSTEDICRWASAHGIDCHIHASRLDRLLPWRRLTYRRIMRRIGGDGS